MLTDRLYIFCGHILLTIDAITVESGIKIEVMTSPFTFYFLLIVGHKLFLKQLAEVLLFLLSINLRLSMVKSVICS